MKKDFLTSTILMIKPTKFGYNVETAVDNVYQKKQSDFANEKIRLQAQKEYVQLVSVLRQEGVNVIEFIDDTPDNTPDSLFPNNWISTHQYGTIFLYPMLANNRRLERRLDIIQFFQNNFYVDYVFDDYLYFESKDVFLEGTGSMVLDRENKIAYACLSQRTNLHLFDKWCEKMQYEGVSFCAKDRGKDVYHTNVLMSVCKKMVFICLDAIVRSNEKEKLLTIFNKTNKEVVDISSLQMNSFLGNVLEIQNKRKESLLIMSSSAFNSLTSFQIKTLNKYVKIVHSPLNTIESFGGGSARCMIAEIFLTKRLI